VTRKNSRASEQPIDYHDILGSISEEQTAILFQKMAEFVAHD
jgi:hypothetical protein